MEWYQNLYIGENIKEKREAIIQKLEKKKRLKDVYVIILPPGEQNQLEIVQPDQIYRYIRQGKLIYVIGLASDMGEAKELIRQMAEKVYGIKGNVFLKEYFLECFNI